MSGGDRLALDTVVRSHWDDALERDGEMLVLCGNQVSLLSALAVEAVLAARDGITVGSLALRLVEAFGAPEGEDPLAHVRGLVAELESRGVLSVEEAE